MTTTQWMAKEERQFVRDAGTGCWVWIGSRTLSGYGLVWSSGKRKRAHRLAYETFRSEIPANMTIDHLCRTPICVNPDHMELVTQRENVLRGYAPSAINARKACCVRGHEFTEANTYRWHGRRCRYCRTCRSEYQKSRVRS